MEASIAAISIMRRSSQKRSCYLVAILISPGKEVFGTLSLAMLDMAPKVAAAWVRRGYAEGTQRRK